MYFYHLTCAILQPVLSVVTNMSKQIHTTKAKHNTNLWPGRLRNTFYCWNCCLEEFFPKESFTLSPPIMERHPGYLSHFSASQNRENILASISKSANCCVFLPIPYTHTFGDTSVYKLNMKIAWASQRFRIRPTGPCKPICLQLVCAINY